MNGYIIKEYNLSRIISLVRIILWTILKQNGFM